MQHHELCDQSISARDVLSAGSINRLNLSLSSQIAMCLPQRGKCMPRPGPLPGSDRALSASPCRTQRGNASACCMCLCVASCTKVPGPVLLHEKLSGVSDVW